VADNFVANAGSGGSTFAADDIGAGVLATRVKPVWGVDGTGTDPSVATPFPVQIIPQTTGGCTIKKVISTANTNDTNVKASAGQVYGIVAVNTNAAIRYLKLYNKATTPTVGTDTPVLTFAIPAATTGAGFTFAIPNGIAFGTGIGYGLTTGVTDADTGAVAANEITVSLLYT
jgi:hypothetical protein